MIATTIVHAIGIAMGRTGAGILTMHSTRPIIALITTIAGLGDTMAVTTAVCMAITMAIIEG